MRRIGRRVCWVLGGVAGSALALVLAANAFAEALPEKPKKAKTTAAHEPLCLLLESAAGASNIPVAFLTRVIWRESRFDRWAVGPRTRGGARAQGIAQFMPSTAAGRDLADPFDPVQALPKAAAYLRDLADRFGNLGLAAAAYNAGPQRVSEWLAGARKLPAETRAYVFAITGRSAHEWAEAGDVRMKTKASCRAMLASLQKEPGAFAYALEARVGAAIAKPWGVELAAGFSRARVLGHYARAVAQLSDLIGDHDPVITRTVLLSRGRLPLYQARIGADTRYAAAQLCARIRKAGAACLVLRNGRR
jgi:hypothetical protein